MIAGRHGHCSLFTYNMRTVRYLEIGRDLQERFPGKTLCAPEIGGLGWTFKGNILDAIAWVSPEALKYHPLNVPQELAMKGIAAIPPRLIIDFLPDLVVSMRLFSQGFRKALRRPGFPPYHLIRRYAIYADPRWRLFYDRYVEVYQLGTTPSSTSLSAAPAENVPLR